MLITNIVELKTFLTVDQSTSMASVAPYIQQSEDTYISKVLGPELYAALQSAYTAAAQTNALPTLSGDWLNLWMAVNKANANLAYYEYLPILATRMSEAGVNQTTTEDTQPIPKWKYDELRIQLRKMGYNSIDKLYQFLAAGSAGPAAWYADWAGSSSFSTYGGHFVNNCTLMTEKGAPINYNTWLFMNMRPVMNMIEQLYIRPEIGEAFFDAVLANFTAGNPATNESTLTGMLQSAIAMYCYAFAIRDPNFRQEIIMTGMTKYDQVPSTGSNRSDVDNPQSFAYVQRQYEGLATGYMGKIKVYLNENASDSVFPLYFASKLYVNPNPNPEWECQHKESNYANKHSKTFFLM